MKDVVQDKAIQRSKSMNEEDRNSVVEEKKNPCIKCGRIFKVIGTELISDARFFVSLSVMATLKLCFITFSFSSPYLTYVYDLPCNGLKDQALKDCLSAGLA